MKRIALWLPFALAACDPTAPPEGVTTATADKVVGCAYVKDISSTPGLFGPLAQAGLEDARNGVLSSAAASGANTVVFEPVEPGAQVYAINAVAYRC